MQQTMNAQRTYTTDDMQFWETLYQTKTLPWDLGMPAPPLQTFLRSSYKVPPGSILILGCGTGHDCMLFAQHGFTVTGIDFAPSAIRATYDKFVQAGIAGKTAFLLERDVFEIHEYDHYFDYVLEHSFFNSIHPSRRRTYAWTVHDLLKPGGKLISLWWTLDRQDGPPYGIPKEDLFGLFSNQFDFDLVHTPNDSVPARQGRELFTLMTAK